MYQRYSCDSVSTTTLNMDTGCSDATCVKCSPRSSVPNAPACQGFGSSSSQYLGCFASPTQTPSTHQPSSLAPLTTAPSSATPSSSKPSQRPISAPPVTSKPTNPTLPSPTKSPITTQPAITRVPTSSKPTTLSPTLKPAVAEEGLKTETIVMVAGVSLFVVVAAIIFLVRQFCCKRLSNGGSRGDESGTVLLDDSRPSAASEYL